VACRRLAAAVVGSPLAPRLAPQDSAGFAALTCSHGGSLRVVPVVNRPGSDAGSRGWICQDVVG
jgi:hypothetical protein